jgi:beta-lactamase class A
MASTFKFVAAAFVLARVDRGEESLARRIVYSRDDLVTYSPITEKHAGGGGMTVGELCDAAVTLSDNTAANLLLDSFGGPAGLTAHMRSLGDGVSRLDRRETALNEAAPGDPRDTTTPAAMLGLLRDTVLGTALSPSSRAQMAAWLVANKTGRQAAAGRRAGRLAGRGQDGHRREQRDERRRRHLAARGARRSSWRPTTPRPARVGRRAERGPGGGRPARGGVGVRRLRRARPAR